MSDASTDTYAGPRNGSILVTGATGYIGGRLVARLLDEGRAVRCLVRCPEKLRSRPWSNHPGLSIQPGDASDPDALRASMQGCRAAYYLVHSMMAVGPEYRRRDRAIALAFARAAAECGLSRIIYLGGLGETGDGLSDHLASRREVEDALASTGIPLTVFRAAMIIGSGSASFEILRYLVERLPVMVTPRWVRTECQPIAVRNVLHYLTACLDEPATVGATLDIGGSEVMRYRDIMREMAASLGLRPRIIVPVPVLTPRLSSLWIHLITPISHRIARPLAEGLRNRVVCRNDHARTLMPQRLLGVREAIDEAVGRRRADQVESSWSDAGPIPGDPDWAGGKVFLERRSIVVRAPAAQVYAALCRIGGDHGYFGADWLWQIRGMLDRLAGGPGMRRGRRSATELRYGEALDFWRVADVQPERRLTLRAEMKLPGKAELTFELEPNGDAPGETVLRQTARFKPSGLLGLAYWCAVVPLHGIVFPRMLLGIRAAAERAAGKA